MAWQNMQSIVQYRFDPDTGEIQILRKFTSAIKGSQNNVRKKKAPKPMISEKLEEEYM